jgi:hypothetical protein
MSLIGSLSSTVTNGTSDVPATASPQWALSPLDYAVHLLLLACDHPPGVLDHRPLERSPPAAEQTTATFLPTYSHRRRLSFSSGDCASFLPRSAVYHGDPPSLA